MINYLFYRIYEYWKNTGYKDIVDLVTPLFAGFLISLNILVINAFLSKLRIIPFLLGHRYILLGTLFVITLSAFLHYRNNKGRILTEFLNEPKPKARRKSRLVTAYVLLSFASLVAVSLFRRGQIWEL